MIRLFYFIYLGQTIHRVFAFITCALRLFYFVYLDEPLYTYFYFQLKLACADGSGMIDLMLKIQMVQ